MPLRLSSVAESTAAIWCKSADGVTQLELHHVGRIFGEDPPISALTDVSLSIDDGDYVAIQGPSGSGKSTLLNVLALIDRPSGGEYFVEGKDASDLSEGDRARLRSETFGFVFQSFHLMSHRSAASNVELGLLYRGVRRRDRRARADAALHAVDMAHRTNVDASKLSGGERQRVAIARAVVSGAKVLVADEPTGNLDSHNGAAIVEQLGALNASGITVILVTHDPAVALHARRRVALRDGLAVEDNRQEVNGGIGTPTQHVPLGPQRGVIGRPSRMRSSDLIRESWNALLGRPGRTGLLVGAVGIAVALVVVTLGLSQTASAQVSSSFNITRNRQVSITVPTVSENGTIRSGLPGDLEARLHQVHGVVRSGALETYDEVAVSALGEPVVPQVTLIGGSPGLVGAADAEVSWATGHRHTLARHEVLVGAFAADDLLLGPLDLDPVVKIGGTDYGVAGIILNSDRAPQLADAIVANWLWASELSHIDTSSVLITTVGGAAPQVARQAPVAIDAVTADSMEVQAPPDPTTLRAAIQGDVHAALLALTLVAMLASILSVANAMLLNVIERIGEFGLRRAIGARPIHILNQTSLEAVIAGALGGAAGLVAGLGVTLGVTIANRWQPVLDLRLAPLALAGGMVVGALGGLPASLRASHIQPSEALRR